MKTLKTQTAPLGHIADIFPGLSLHGRSPAGKGSHTFLYVNTGSFANGLIETSELEAIQVEAPEKVERYQLKPGDVILTIRGNNPKAAVCPPTLDGCVISANLCAIRLRPNAGIGPYLLQGYLESPEGQATLLGLSQGSATLSIRPKVLCEMAIPIPPSGKANQLEELRKTLIHMRQLTLSALQQQERIFAAILQNCMS